MNYSRIGGADGPTTIFLTEELSFGWLNIFGLIIVILILIPNIIYAIKFRGVENQCKNKVVNVLEQIGRYASMLLMIFNIEILAFGFSSVRTFITYIVGNSILLLLYWIVWVGYFIKQSFVKNMVLAVIPTLIFMLCGVTLRHLLLIVCAVIFGIGHICVTYKNKLKEENQ